MLLNSCDSLFQTLNCCETCPLDLNHCGLRQSLDRATPTLLSAEFRKQGGPFQTLWLNGMVSLTVYIFLQPLYKSCYLCAILVLYSIHLISNRVNLAIKLCCITLYKFVLKSPPANTFDCVSFSDLTTHSWPWGSSTLSFLLYHVLCIATLGVHLGVQTVPETDLFQFYYF